MKMVTGLVENFTIPTELLSSEPARFQLNVGLDMMNLAVEGLEAVQPGVRENIVGGPQLQGLDGRYG